MPNLRNLLEDISTQHTVRAGQPLLFQGEIPRHVYMVLDGIVRAYIITDSGEERYISLYSKGDTFPLSFAVGEANTALFFYEALSDTRLLKVKKSDFDDRLANDPALARSLLSRVGKEYTTLMLRITSLSQSRTIDKLAYTFYYLVYRYGLERKSGFFELNIRLTQSMLANLIGQTREGVARNIKDLKKAGVIDYKGVVYNVHKEKLIAFMGEDSFREIEN